MINGLAHRDERLCLRLHQASSLQRMSPVLGAASVLGNGFAWYLLMIVLASTAGPLGRRCTLVMLATAVVTHVLFVGLKKLVARQRPFERIVGICPTVPPLDRWSFPSGHTSHAVAFTLVAGSAFPSLLWALLPFTGLVMVSRVVLGLHYPSDVAGGALCGYLAARLCLDLSQGILPL